MSYPKYTPAERLEMIRRYYGGLSFQGVRDHFAAEHPDRPIPSVHTIRSTVLRLEKTYCLANGHKKIPRPRRALSENVCLLICAAVTQNPNASSSEISRQVGTSRSSVIKVLHKNGYHYSMQSHNCGIWIHRKGQLRKRKEIGETEEAEESEETDDSEHMDDTREIEESEEMEATKLMLQGRNHEKNVQGDFIHEVKQEIQPEEYKDEPQDPLFIDIECFKADPG
ncbi:uncharacterized protein LOC124414937 [Diprion similis]|uniref:uncharacterized protein LOC124414937 n=1 Tax=Diprion similis TaxID=362088 RepID=UPI001EF7BEDB|nr:uncharacterized protein LOC124414937 [Diprion similis]XP_046752085.1 uncharacterized protein LOC124414937 [Diprion similis]